MDFLRTRLGTLKEKLRDKTRDKVCDKLCAIGLDAHMAERGLSEEDVVGDTKGESLGLIEIRGSPISWVNVIRTIHGGGGGGHKEYTNIYIIPDRNIGGETLELRSVRVKNIPLIGRVVDVYWKGNFTDELIRQMNEDALLKQILIELKEDIAVRGYPPHGCWVIRPKRFWDFRLISNLKRIVPSRETWYCYETIARYLLKRRIK